MPPKKNPAFEEVDDMKKTLDFLIEQMDTVKTQQKEILALVTEVRALRTANEEKDKKIADLECRIADLEQYS